MRGNFTKLPYVDETMTNPITQSQSKTAPFTASPRALNILAALIWYVGGVILFLKARSLLVEANAMQPGQIWPWAAVIAGLLFGGLKAYFIFNKSCRRNLVRIVNLDAPKIWQFYRPGFFLFLALMITAGAALSRMAHGNYPFLIGVAILDFSISFALLGSSVIYWQHRAFH